jgi:hypothetical protein
MARPVAAAENATTPTAPPPTEKNPSELTTADDSPCEIDVPGASHAPGENNSTGAVISGEQNATGAPLVAKSAAEIMVAREVASNVATVVDQSSVVRRPRLRILNRITDGLTPGQYAVYRAMYEEGKNTDDRGRIYTGGYADLGRLTGMSKRGIQNVVGDLQAKEVIRIHRKPGHHRTETSAYIVPDAARVVETWLSKGWRHAAGKSKVLTP